MASRPALLMASLLVLLCLIQVRAALHALQLLLCAVLSAGTPTTPLFSAAALWLGAAAHIGGDQSLVKLMQYHQVQPLTSRPWPAMLAACSCCWFDWSSSIA